MRSIRFFSYSLTACIAILSFSSCEFFRSTNQPVTYLGGYNATPNQTAESATNPHAIGYWDGDGVSGPALIKINLGEQKAYFYKGPHLVAATPISTGIEGRVTQRGIFKVTQKNRDHHSSLYGVIKDNATGNVVNDDATVGKDIPGPGQTFVRAPMTNFLRFNGAVGMHTGHLPGYAASHGCVRLPDNMARHFFDNAVLGTPVIVE